MGKRRQTLGRDEIKLILESEEIKNKQTYGNLYQVLALYGTNKGAHLNDLEGLDMLAERAISDNIEKMKERVVNEWRVINSEGLDSNMRTKCSLCGTPNKYIFYIKNRLNGTELNVGSTCMKNFSDMEGYKTRKENERKEKTKQAVIRNIAIFREHFSEAFPIMGDDVFEEAEEFYNSLAILLSSGLNKRFNSCLEEMKETYNLFINGKLKKQISFNIFKECLKRYELIKQEIEQFVEANKMNSLSCKRREINWLLDANKTEILKIIRENEGVYSLQAMKHMYSHEFMQEHKDIFKRGKREGLFSLKEIDDQKIIFMYEGRYVLRYTISLKDYMQLFGAYCIMKSDYCYNDYDLLEQKQFIIENTTDNKEVVISVLNAQIKAIGGVLAYDVDMDKLWLIRLNDKAIKTFDIKAVIDLFSKREIMIDNNFSNLLKSFQRLIKRDKGWLSKEEQAAKLVPREQKILKDTMEIVKYI